MDSGRWGNALLIMQSREMPSSHVLRAPIANNSDDRTERKYSPLLDEAWIGAFNSYKKDMKVLAKNA